MATALRETVELDFEAFDALLEDRPDWERWELIDGVAIMMSPPYQRHQLIAYNVVALLARHAEERGADWYPYPAIGVRDLRQTHRTTIPDVVVRNGPLLESPYCGDPIVLVEIVSHGSVRVDLGWKKDFYSRIATAWHYLVVRQDQLQIDAYHRAAGWELKRLTGPDERVALAALDVSLSLRDIYRRTGLLPD